MIFAIFHTDIKKKAIQGLMMRKATESALLLTVTQTEGETPLAVRQAALSAPQAPTMTNPAVSDQ